MLTYTETRPGYLGNLTPEEVAKVKEMWVRTAIVCDRHLELEEKLDPSLKEGVDTKQRGWASIGEGTSKITPAELRASLWEAVKVDHPDALILRYLRARKWDVEKAFAMMLAALRWRVEDLKLDSDIMRQGEEFAVEQSKSSDPVQKAEGEGFMLQLRQGKSFVHGRDNGGRPISIVRARLHRGRDQTSSSIERFTVFNIETTRLVMEPPIDLAVLIFDLSGFGLSNMDYTPVKFIISCFEANYPESLERIVVYNAPWVFNGIWRIIKGWLDPVVAAKVHFINGAKELSKTIPMDQIIKDLGGEDQYEWNYIEPVAGENDSMKDTATRDSILAEREKLNNLFEDLSARWVMGESVEDERDDVARQLKINYCNIDPYVRARSIYDRLGMIDLKAKREETEAQRAAHPVATSTPPADFAASAPTESSAAPAVAPVAIAAS